MMDNDNVIDDNNGNDVIPNLKQLKPMLNTLEKLLLN